MNISERLSATKEFSRGHNPDLGLGSNAGNATMLVMLFWIILWQIKQRENSFKFLPGSSHFAVALHLKKKKNSI